MNAMSGTPAFTYRNAMESLVVEELERQVQRLPQKQLAYLNTAEVVAYALNRLPALYATSEKGWQQQRLRGKNELSNHISTAVRQAIVAVQRDPLRVSVPLRSQQDLDANAALQGLRQLLGREELSWKNLVDAVEHTLVRTARGEITWRKQGSHGRNIYDWNDNRYHL